VTQIQTVIGGIEQEVGGLRRAFTTERREQMVRTTSSWCADTTRQRKTLSEQLCC